MSEVYPPERYYFWCTTCLPRHTDVCIQETTRAAAWERLQNMGWKRINESSVSQGWQCPTCALQGAREEEE
jgi:hypothetical protein